MSEQSSRWLLACACAAGLIACTNGESAGGGRRAEPDIRPLSAQLVKAESCEDLLSEIQADAIARVDLAVAQLRAVAQGGGQTNADRSFEGLGTGGTGGSFGPSAGVPGVGPGGAMMPAATSSTVAQPTAPPAANNPTPGPAASAPTPILDANDATDEVAVSGPEGYSDTNRQVQEVDEADIVKVDADGRFVYLLHGDRLVVLRSWPAEETALAREVVLDAPLDGRPYEMFVDEGRVVLFSSVRDGSQLRAQEAGDQQTPRPQPDACFDCYYDDPSFTKATVIDMNGDSPEVERELFFEGYYVSSRRHDSRVRAVIRGGFRAPTLYRPSVEYLDPWGMPHPQDVIDEQIDAWRERTVGSILSTTLDHWLPGEHERIDGELVSVARRCSDFYIPAPALVDYGLTSIVELDLSGADQAIGGATILGDAAEVYSNTETMLIAHADYRSDPGGQGGARTVLHTFELGETGLSYRASGFVDGQILNQFSLDERDGVVRVTTVSEGSDPQTGEFATDNRLRTLRAAGDELEVIGETPNLGKPRETIRSTRFVGDRAYVVTFERTDPLVVVGLADPERPEVLGQVEIPGFSTYMHPLGEDHLLTIGEFVDPANGGNRALQLQIFDVSDPTDPQQAESYVFPLGGNSLASQEHKAFNYHADRELLAFPYINWNTLQSTLEVFHVSVAEGFERLGAVDHVGLFDNCYNYPAGFEGEGGLLTPVPPTPAGQTSEQAQRRQAFHACPGQGVRRGVFIDDYVMSISYGGVLVHEVAGLSTTSDEMDAVARVDLDRPRYPDWSGNQFAGGGFAGRPVTPMTIAPPVAPPPMPAPEPVAMDPAPAFGGQAGSGAQQDAPAPADDEGVNDPDDAEEDLARPAPEDAGVDDAQ